MRSVIEPAEAQLNHALCSDFEGLLVATNSEVNSQALSRSAEEEGSFWGDLAQVASW